MYCVSYEKTDDYDTVRSCKLTDIMSHWEFFWCNIISSLPKFYFCFISPSFLLPTHCICKSQYTSATSFYIVVNLFIYSLCDVYIYQWCTTRKGSNIAQHTKIYWTQSKLINKRYLSKFSRRSNGYPPHYCDKTCHYRNNIWYRNLLSKMSAKIPRSIKCIAPAYSL